MRGAGRGLLSSDALIPHPRPAPDARRCAPTGDPGDVFVGRVEELAALDTAAQAVRGRNPQVVLVEGPAGIGKTALAERFLRDAGDLRTVRCAGDRHAPTRFGLVDQLFRGVGMTGARLLAGAGSPCFQPHAVGAQLLTFLAEHESDGPVALLADNLQWADPESLRALLFALRRLAAQRVLTLLLTRDEAATPAEDLSGLAARSGGTRMALSPLTVRDVGSLAASVDAGAAGALPTGLITRLRTHTRGNPSYLRAVLAELTPESWWGWKPVLPAPPPVARWAGDVVAMCPPPARSLAEAAAVLGDGSRLSTAARLAGIDDPLGALEVAGVVGLLALRDAPTGRRVVFPHPMVRAAVYEQLAPARRVLLHLRAAELADDDAARLRHRVGAADPPDERLAQDLSEFAQRQAATGRWAGATSSLLEAARLSGEPWQRERRRWQAFDLLAGTGELGQVRPPADGCGPATGALRAAVLGHLAILRGRRDEAQALLDDAWRRCDLSRDRPTAALVAERRALHGLGRLHGGEVVEWARRAGALFPATGPAPMPDDALLGLGLALAGRRPEALAALDPPGTDDPDGVASLRRRIARGTLRVVADDIPAARAELSAAVRSEHRLGLITHRVWAYVWLSRAEFLAGSWDDSALAAERAVALVAQTDHDWLRPLARWAAGAVPAARGDQPTAEEHARLASAHDGDHELMILAAAMARAQLAAARTDHETVLRALEPVLRIHPRDGIDEPGFWPWPELYADALVTAGQLERADAFLRPHEHLAAARGSRSTIALLARVRGRLEAAAGHPEAAQTALRHGLAQLDGLHLPFPQALLELAHGQLLRRLGHRRAAAGQLHAARDRFAALGARPYLRSCEQELSASGSLPAARDAFDPGLLTAQELAVALLVARGRSNRQVAAELFISIKTVQFHLTRVYAKLRVSSRVELVANSASFAPGQGASR